MVVVVVVEDAGTVDAGSDDGATADESFDDELQPAANTSSASRHTTTRARQRDIAVQSASRCQLLRQPRSNGSRHASGAISW